MQTARLFTALILTAVILPTHAATPPPLPAYSEVLRQADELLAARQHEAALNLLSDSALRHDLTDQQRQSAALRVAQMIHSSDHSLYPLLRERLDHLLLQVPLDDGGKLKLLESIEGTYIRTHQPAEAVTINKRMLELSLPDARRAQLLAGLANTYIHQLRQLDVGRTYYHESIALQHQAVAAISNLTEKAARLAAIGHIYQNQTREPDKATPLYEQAVALYQAALPELKAYPKASALGALALLQQRLGHMAEARELEELAVAECLGILDAAGRLAAEEWVAAVMPLETMRLLRLTPAGCRRALALTEEMLAERAEPALRQLLPRVVSEAEWICRYGKELALRSRVSWTLEQRIELASTPREENTIRLQLGESYFRIDRELDKARQTFARVAAAEEASAADRATAQLWCEMLADET